MRCGGETVYRHSCHCLLELNVLHEHRRGRGRLRAVPAPPAAERVGHRAGQAAAVVGVVVWVEGWLSRCRWVIRDASIHTHVCMHVKQGNLLGRHLHVAGLPADAEAGAGLRVVGRLCGGD